MGEKYTLSDDEGKATVTRDHRCARFVDSGAMYVCEVVSVREVSFDLFGCWDRFDEPSSRDAGVEPNEVGQVRFGALR